MQKYLRGVALAAATVASVFLTAAPSITMAQESPSSVSAAEAVVTRWFVELNSAPTADGGSVSSTRADKAAFKRNADKAGLKFKEVHAFDVLWNGLSVEIAPGQASRLARIEGVKRVFPVETYRIPDTTPGENPDLATALNMTGATSPRTSSAFRARASSVAVMDTGVDYDHPDLGGCFGPGCRVVTGYDFVGDAFNADPASPAYNPVTAPDAIPDDCNGHGTHVAGIVGASDGDGARASPPASPSAPTASSAATARPTADVMIAAMERALADGMHVVNMSIGSSFQWPQYPTAQGRRPPGQQGRRRSWPRSATAAPAASIRPARRASARR